jgi:hypothetical protein
VSTTARWVVAAIAFLLVIGLLGWARGEEHHRGDDRGAMTTFGR